jgi:hypothetical protein
MSDLGFDAELTANRRSDLSVTGQLPNVNTAAEVPSGLSRPAAKSRWPQGGLQRDALAAILNPALNFYKRINAPRTLSGATCLDWKHQAWDDFSRHLTDRERDATLDC